MATHLWQQAIIHPQEGLSDLLLVDGEDMYGISRVRMVGEEMEVSYYPVGSDQKIDATRTLQPGHPLRPQIEEHYPHSIQVARRKE